MSNVPLYRNYRYVDYVVGVFEQTCNPRHGRYETILSITTDIHIWLCFLFLLNLTKFCLHNFQLNNYEKEMDVDIHSTSSIGRCDIFQSLTVLSSLVEVRYSSLSPPKLQEISLLITFQRIRHRFYIQQGRWIISLGIFHVC